MAKKKKEHRNEGSGFFVGRLKDETFQGILAVAFFVISLFFILALFDLAGPIGKKIYWVLEFLFGYGYFLLPLVFSMLAIAYLRNIKKPFAGMQSIGGLLFFISALGLVNLIRGGKGGVVGKIISNPLISLFDVYAAGVILIALLIISFLIIFDTSISFSFLTKIRNLFTSKKKEDNQSQLKISDPEVSIQNITTPSEPMLKKIFPSHENNDIKEKNSEEEFIPKKLKSFSLKSYTPPPLSLLEKDSGRPDVGDIKANANIIKRTLQNFGIAVEMDEVSIGPSVTRYALKPAEGVKLSRILSLQNNLELALAAHPVRIEAPIPGKSLVGIEIPNSTKSTVGLGSLLSEPEFQNSDKPLLISIGKGISGKSHFGNLDKMPHLLVAGATGSGKSVTIHAIITSLLFRNSPENLKFILIDPKRVELTLYNNIPHLLTPVITDAKKTILALKWATKEMDRRYDVLETVAVRDIESYHKNILEPELKSLKEKKLNKEEELPEMMPYILVIIDELADIMSTYPRELESAVVRLAQMSRAVGIHLILSTQRPSVNIITGLIKANIPSRIALQVVSQVDSRTILDISGAEKLLGAGDMLYLSGEMSKPQRLQSAFISETEVKKVVKYLKENYESDSPEIEFSGGSTRDSLFESGFNESEDDDLYEEARETVIMAGKASTSYLQRKLGIGYARAARLMDMLEERGIVGPGSGAKPREVLIERGTTTITEDTEDKELNG